MGTIGDRFGDLAALFGAEGEAASPSGANPEPAAGEGSPTGLNGILGGSGADAEGSAVGGTGVGGADAGGPGVGDSDTLDAQEDAPAAPTLESVIADTIVELNRTEAANQGPDLDLDFTALDLSGLPLWALVAEVERFLGRKFTDEQVETWESPRDILRAAEDPED